MFTKNYFEIKRIALVEKFKNEPESVTKEDLDSYESFYALKTYFWETKKGKAGLGKFTVTHHFRLGLKSNSGKSKTLNQHQFIITDNESHESWVQGFIIPQHNRRSRGANVESYERE